MTVNPAVNSLLGKSIVQLRAVEDGLVAGWNKYLLVNKNRT